MHLLSDIRYGLRALVSRPGFTIVAILALTLGIGANTAIFSVVNAVLLKPLSYNEPDRIMTLLHSGTNPVAPANFFDLQDQSRTFEAMTATQWWEPTMTGQDTPEQLKAIQGTADMFRVFGVAPMLGRAFLPGEDQPGNEQVVVLSHGLWQRRFGADEGVLGQTVTLNGAPYTVIGVMPSGYQFVPFWLSDAELCTPLNLSERLDDRGGQSLRVFGRLNPDVTQGQAQAEITALMGRLVQAYPESNTNLTIRVDPAHEKVVGDIRPVLLILLGAVGFVLLIACANVANLLLGRAVSRRREIAIRMAVGADRSRVISQLLTESLLLSCLGGAGGLLLALWGIDALVAMSPASIPRVATIQLDTSVLAFTLIMSVVTGLLFGLVPALQTSRTEMTDAMKEGGRGAAEGHQRARFRSGLIVTEVALTLMLLIGAGLMLRSFMQLQNIDPGFDDRNLLTMTVSVAGSQHADPARRPVFFQQLIEQVEALPGVSSVSAINHLPLNGDLWGLTVSFEGRPPPEPGDRVGGTYRVVHTGYFQTMNIPLIQGRDFTDRDVMGVPGVAIINETLARRHFPDEDPIGKRIDMGNPDHPEWMTIIGIAGDTKQGSWVESTRNDVYMPYLQSRLYMEESGSGFQYLTLVVRTAGDPMALASAVKETAWSIDKNAPVSKVTSMEQVVAEQLWQPRFSMFLFTIFAVVALVLAGIGIYGVMAYAVSQRTHEIGIRVALGAQRRDILTLILGRGLLLTVIGAGIGVALAAGMMQVMTDMLYGITATDPATFIVGTTVLVLIALLACYIPARRAMRVNPVVALKYD